MNGNTLYNVPDPVNPQDVATKEYADQVGGGERAIIKTQYGNNGAIGNIDMQGYTLTNVLDPADGQDVATRQYVDNKITHMIVAYGRYQGELITDEYQFSFGGVKAHDPTTGFFVPQSGRIRKIKMRTPINKESFEDKISERNKVDIAFINQGFFDFTNKKNNGELKKIGIIRCQNAYKLYFQWDKYATLDKPEIKYLYDFCFEDDFP